MTSLKVAGIFTSIQQTIKTSSGSAVNIVICLVTVGSEQLFSFAVFTCPCTNTSSSERNSTVTTGISQNAIYGWVFIVVPALALFVLGYAMNIKTWKLLTGCVHRSSKASRGCRAGVRTLLEVFMQALVAPAAWMSVAFLDGKYYACATSDPPYTGPCDKPLERMMTTDYETKKQQSQIIGWCLVAAIFIIGSFCYTIHRCFSPLTYHHRKYARWYREMESEAFEKKAREQIKKEVEGETVTRFLSEKREKKDWDKISTVFDFIRDDNKFALYSRLDQWNEENPAEINMTTISAPTNDDSSLDRIMNETSNNNTAIEPSGMRNGIGNIKHEVPRIPPPPTNQNAGRRRSSFSGGDNEEVTSQHQPNSMQMHSMTPFGYKALLPQKQILHNNMKCTSMPDIPKAKSENVKVQSKLVYSGAPTYDDDEEAL